MKNKNFGRKRQAIYILSNRKSTRIIKTLMDFFFFIKVKIKMVCFSVPSDCIEGDAFVTINKIKELGCKAGIALNPSVPLETIEYYLPLLDKVTIMIVDAGISGQKVIEQTYDKIRKLVKIREEKGLDFLIEADGSMNRDVYRSLYEAGADMVVLGPPALWNKADDFEEAWAIMENELESELN